MKIMQRFFGLMLILILGGCATVSVKWDYDPGMNFSGLKPTTESPGPEKPTNEPMVDQDSLLDLRIRTSVEEELAAKGFSRRPSGQPDSLIGFYLTLEKKVSATTALSLYTYSTWGEHLEGGYDEFEVGTLILDIVSPETRKLMWRGSARDAVELSRSHEIEVARINKAVTRILEKFPPK